MLISKRDPLLFLPLNKLTLSLYHPAFIFSSPLSHSSLYAENRNSITELRSRRNMKKIVLKLDLHDGKQKQKALKTVSALSGIDSITMDMKEKKLTVIGVVDPITTVSKLRKYWPTTDIIFVGPAKEPEKPAEKKEEGAKAEDGKKDEGKKEGGGEEGKKGEGKKEGGGEAKKEGGDDKKKDEKKAPPVVIPIYDPAMWEMMKARAYNPQMLAHNNPHMTYYNPHHMMTPYNPPMTSYNPPMTTYYAQSHEENPNGTCTIS